MKNLAPELWAPLAGRRQGCPTELGLSFTVNATIIYKYGFIKYKYVR